MEIFHTHKLGLGVGSVCGWSKASGHQALLAVGIGSNAVGVYTEEARPLDASNEALIKNVRATEATAIAWHPRLPLLAIGWRDGGVSYWNADQRRLEEDSKVHRSTVSALVWHSNGERLASTDEAGKLAMWKADKALKPVLVTQIEEKEGRVTLPTWGAPAANSGAAGAALALPVYYVVSAPGSSNVALKWLDDMGRSGTVQDMGEQLHALLHYPEQDQLVAVTTVGTLLLLGRDAPASVKPAGSTSKGQWSTLLRTKLPSSSSNGEAAPSVTWAGPHTIASAGDKDTVLRLYNFETEDNYTLALDAAAVTAAGSSSGRYSDDVASGPTSGVACLAYDAKHQLLAAGTLGGRVVAYRQRPAASIGDEGLVELSKTWEAQPSFQIGAVPKSLSWGPSPRLMVAVCGNGSAFVCRKALLHHKVSEGMAAVQVASDRIVVESVEGPPKAPGRITTSLQISGLDVTKGALLVTDGTTAELHRIAEDNTLTLASSFQCPAGAGSATGGAGSSGQGCSMALYGESVYRTGPGRVEVCNWSGTVKQTLTFDEAREGAPCVLDTQRDFLAVATSSNSIRVFKLGGREARPHAGPGVLLAPEGPGRPRITSLRVNANGTMIAAIVSRVQPNRDTGLGDGTDASTTGSSSGGSRVCDPVLYVFSTEANTTLRYDFAKDGKMPLTVSWDLNEPRLMAVHTQALEQQDTNTSNQDMGNDGSAPTASGAAAAGTSSNAMDVALLFATPSHGLLLQEYQDLDSSRAGGFLGVAAPHLLVNRRSVVSPPGAAPFTSYVGQVPMQGFSGLQDVDEATRHALLDFSYHLATGSLDDAFRAVSSVRAAGVWEAMAHMAIKSKRLDVAEHCLGNMGHARAARALRESVNEPELDARVALVAVHLGMTEDAARLLAGCGRWDLLTQLWCGAGQWDRALEVAEKHDRMHLKSVHHTYAQHLERCGDIKGAILHYEAAGTATQEVSRMLYEQGQLAALEQYVSSSGAVPLLMWWARLCESRGDFAKALACYERAGKRLAAVRVYCATGNWRAAEEVVTTTQDPAAAFHLARLYEAQERVGDAVRCYSIAKRYSHAARLAKRYELEQELLSLALKSPAVVMLDAAEWFLERGQPDRAVQLFQKGGKPGRAMDVAFGAQLPDAMRAVSDDLGPDSDPMLLARCAEFFLQHGQHEQAVRLFISGRQQQRALDLILECDVSMSDDMAEALTPEKTPDNAEDRAAVLMRIAQAAKRQGQFHLACKKYTQAGDRHKAMRALVKSGDTEKIVFFAGVSRQREVYLMAANYLQSLDWHASPDIMRHIITFYTKAQAHDALAGFYESCAAIEVDEYRDYDKALQALQEAAKHLAKARTTDREERLAMLAERIELTQQFAGARAAMAGGEAARGVQMCQELLARMAASVPESEAGVRIGDVYALLVEYCCESGEAAQATALVEQMAARGIPLGPYLDSAMVNEAFQAVGKPPPLMTAAPAQQHQQHQQAGSDDMEEEVQDELPFMQDDDNS